MNQTDKKLEALSAHLDGEHADEVVLGLLREDASLARVRDEYAQLGALLRSLPDPEVHPAFATRVVAHAREAGRAPAWNPWRLLAPLAGVAAVLVIVGYAARDWQTGTTTVSPMQPAQETVTVALRKDWTNEETVVEEMTKLIDEGVVLELYPEEETAVVEDAPEAETPSEESLEDWQEAIARDVFAYVSSDYWKDTTEEVLWDAPDYEDEIQLLNGAERKVFMELMTRYGSDVS